jgi:hypothetical protein
MVDDSRAVLRPALAFFKLCIATNSIVADTIC